MSLKRLLSSIWPSLPFNMSPAKYVYWEQDKSSRGQSQSHLRYSCRICQKIREKKNHLNSFVMQVVCGDLGIIFPPNESLTVRFLWDIWLLNDLKQYIVHVGALLSKILILLFWSGNLGTRVEKINCPGDSNVQPDLRKREIHLYLSTININYPCWNKM